MNKPETRWIFSRTDNGRPSRSGSVLIVAIACMVFASTVLIGLVQVSLRHRRQLRQDIQLEQTEWLVEAGARKAIRKLGESPEYDGETIELETGIGKFKQATIKIDVADNPSDENQLRLKVVAQIGRSVENSTTQRTLVLILNKPKSETEDSK